MKLMSKVAIVTGGSNGIGRAIAVKLAQEGAKVSILDLADCSETLRQIANLGFEADYYQVNVSDYEMVKQVFSQILNKHKVLDILVNNAGINRDSMLHKMSIENWQLVLNIDLNAVFYTTQLAVQQMRPRGYGRIINISSGSWLGNIGQANYAAAKAGVVGLTKTAARENAGKGITCNVICPGFITTPMTLKLKEINGGKPWDSMMGRIPAGHAGEPVDVANAVAFLASDEASYITSEVINVGGGMIV